MLLPAAQMGPEKPQRAVEQPAVVVESGRTPASAKRLAKRLTVARGWDRGRQWLALTRLWSKESGWRHDADNPTSSAYGIPQLLHLKPGTPAYDQIMAGLRYIEHRYGSPVAAWEFWKRHKWY